MAFYAHEFYAAAGLDVTAPEMAWCHSVRLRRISKGKAVDVEKRKYQIKALYNCMFNDRWGLFDEPGTGKTLPAQGAILYRVSYGNKTLVVMPPRLLDQFEEAFSVGWEGHPFRIVTIADGPEPRALLRSTWNKEGWPDVLMMSYQMFLKLVRPQSWTRVASKEDPSIKETKQTTRGEWRDDILREYRLLVCDEAQALKNYASGTSSLAYEFVYRDNAGFIPMTGTPIHNEVKDAYGLIKLLNPDAYFNFEQFEATHFVYGYGESRFRKLVAYKNLDVVTANLYRNASRVLKREAMPWLPPVQVLEVPVTLEKWHYALYKKMVEERVLEIGDTVLDLTSEQALRMACLRCAVVPEKFSESLPKTAKNNVLEALDTILDTIGFSTPEVDPNGIPIDPRPGQKSKRKVIVVCHFQDSVRAIVDRYKDCGAVAIYGGASPAEARKAEKRFKEDPACRMVVINARSGGAGFNFQDWCSNVVFVEPTGVPGEFQQTVDRIDRGDQNEQCTVWIIKVKRTSYITLVRNMQQKAEAVVHVNRDRKTLLRDLAGELDEYDYEANAKASAA